MSTPRWSEFTNKLFTTLERKEQSELLSSILSYTICLILPHISNRFYIRELSNMIFGLIILCAQYTECNLYIIMISILSNFLLMCMPVKQKHIRTRIVVCANLVFIFGAYMLYNPIDSDPFTTLASLFMKYTYLAGEYHPGSEGVLAYFGYVLFPPGLRYGPVLSYAEYNKWLDLGYFYALKYITKEELEKEIREEKNEKKIEEIKENLLITKYSTSLMVSIMKFNASWVFRIAHAKAAAYSVEKVQNMSFPMGFGLLEILSMLGQYLWISRWWTEESLYLLAGIPGMSNCRVRKFSLSKNFSEACSLWNPHGSKFMRTMFDRMQIIEKNENLSKVKEFIAISIVSHMHIFMLPPFFINFVVCFFTSFVISCIEQTDENRRGAFYSLVTLINSRLLFSYYFIGSIYNFKTVVTLWKSFMYIGHVILIKLMHDCRKKLSTPEPASSSPRNAPPAVPEEITNK
ncbi:hypothetical protein NEFER03_1448 [Nematocida sp. LUAm3]|nr:hypothetical protein NEFER03_1448 [Nematocida sp. LUAm3]KAI5174722.1 hypothetical protein NEFER02_0832 [Nematocida sp. LUAm2]KAI5177867.1 hypothetical protein NEFER01_1069 [Nematocida sp. LUAm1]